MTSSALSEGVIKGIDVSQKPAYEGFDNVFFVELGEANAVELPKGFTSVDDMLDSLPTDDGWEQALIAARKELSEKLHPDTITVASLRLARGWTQRQLAEKYGSSQAHIARIESGKDDVRISTIEKLSEVFNVSACTVMEAIQNAKRMR